MSEPNPVRHESEDAPETASGQASVEEVKTTSVTERPRKRPRRRIAQKLLLSYVLPMAVLIVAGIVLPFLLWSWLGRPYQEYRERAQFVELAESLQRSAVESENLIRGYVLFNDTNFVEEFNSARQEFNANSQRLFDLATEVNSPRLQLLLDTAQSSYLGWVRQEVLPELRRRNRQQVPPEAGRPSTSGVPSTSAVVRASRIRIGFVSVRSDLDNLVASARQLSQDQRERAQFADMLRRITSVAIPVASVLLAMLIGRSIALGITRPLEELTQATERLEQADANPLVIADSIGSRYSDDEIGELQRSFQQMARTIGQREAVLRAQNEALGALNRRVEAVLNATNDGIVLLDRTGAFAVVNIRFAELFGLEPDVLLDQPYRQAAPLLISRFKHRARVRERLDAIVNDPNALAEETFDIAEPVARTIRVYSAPVQGPPMSLDEQDDTRLGRIFVFRDVTRETAVDRMKTEFVATVSHELRTPLTAIKGYVDLMLTGKTGDLTPVQQEFLQMTQGSTERLTALINDILDISRIESGRMEIRQETVEYLPLVQQAIRLMESEAGKKQITLTLATPIEEIPHVPTVRGDSDRITQVLMNLISNGIKYTPTGGTVQVLVEPQEDFIATCISDSGVGISRQDQARLFQKFFRADNSTTREAGGTGLGLAITKAILDKMGGSIWVNSEVGKGSQFWFTLPVADEADKPISSDTDTEPLLPEPNGAALAETAEKTLILTVADDATILHRLNHTLRQLKFITSGATNLADALRRARGLRPDLILLNPFTSRFDGFAALRTLRDNPATATVPVALAVFHDTGARLEISDGATFLPRTAEQEAFQQAIRQGLGPKAFAEHSASASRSTRAVILVVGSYQVAERVREMVGDVSTIHVVATATTEEADSRVSGLFPDLVVLDTEALVGNPVGEWLSRLQNRRPEVRLVLVILTDPELLAGPTRLLAPPGSGMCPLAHVGECIQDTLRQFRQENPTAEQTDTEQSEHIP
ncbi:MAG: hypothetical protein OHK0029_22170 [Armatimonadaceae bacterium]